MKPYRRKEIGEIDGITVYGQYYDEGGEPSVVLIQWKSGKSKPMACRFGSRRLAKK